MENNDRYMEKIENVIREMMADGNIEANTMRVVAGLAMMIPMKYAVAAQGWGHLPAKDYKNFLPTTVMTPNLGRCAAQVVMTVGELIYQHDNITVADYDRFMEASMHILKLFRNMKIAAQLPKGSKERKDLEADAMVTMILNLSKESNA